MDIGAILADPNLWNVLLGLFASIFILPAGVGHGLLVAGLAALSQRAQAQLPANVYAVVKALATDAVTYAYQRGSAEAWDNEQKKAAALAQLDNLMADHHIALGKLDAETLDGMIEAAWALVKPVLYEADARAQAAKVAATAPTATLPLPLAPLSATLSGPLGTWAGNLPSDGAAVTFHNVAGTAVVPIPGIAFTTGTPDAAPAPAEPAVALPA